MSLLAALILDLTLRTLSVIAMTSPNLHENKLLEYVMQFDIAESLIRVQLCSNLSANCPFHLPPPFLDHPGA